MGAAYTSNGSAGELLPSAEVILGSGALDSISGTLSLTNGVSAGDLFEISITDPANFSASTVLTKLGTNNFDTQLFLFDATGRGIAGNDDSATSSQSLLSSSSLALSSLSSGTYYLLIEGSGRYPVDASNNYLFANILTGADGTGTYAANPGVGAFSALKGNSSEGGGYKIALTGASFVPVPEPSVIALLLAGAGLCELRRRRRPANDHRVLRSSPRK